MANMMRWEPYSDAVSLREAMDQLFESALVGLGSSAGNRGGHQGWYVPVDVTENEDYFVIEASLPGINPDDLNITVQENVLTLAGEMKQQEEKKEQRYHLRERRFGSFTRSIMLPTVVKASDVQAEYTDGILRLTLPKAEEARPRRIQVKTGGSGQKTIEGQSSQQNPPSQHTPRS